MKEKIILKQKSRAYMTLYTLHDYILARPMIIIFPGGGYDHLSLREGEQVALMFNSLGMNAAVVSYEVHTPYPESLITASNAVVYARQNAAKLHIDTEKVIVCGFSAGAHLAASLGTLWNKEPAILRADNLNSPSGMILSYPVITGGEFAHRQSFTNLGADTDELLKKFSAEQNVDCDTPPAFIWHTFADETVPMENSMLMASAMRKNNIPFELHIFPEGCHGLSLATKETAASEDMILPHVQHWTELAREWIELF